MPSCATHRAPDHRDTGPSIHGGRRTSNPTHVREIEQEERRVKHDTDLSDLDVDAEELAEVDLDVTADLRRLRQNSFNFVIEAFRRQEEECEHGLQTEQTEQDSQTQQQQEQTTLRAPARSHLPAAKFQLRHLIPGLDGGVDADLEEIALGLYPNSVDQECWNNSRGTRKKREGPRSILGRLKSWVSFG